jgi:hypothetical protein
MLHGGMENAMLLNVVAHHLLEPDHLLLEGLQQLHLVFNGVHALHDSLQRLFDHDLRTGARLRTHGSGSKTQVSGYQVGIDRGLAEVGRNYISQLILE